MKIEEHSLILQQKALSPRPKRHRKLGKPPRLSGFKPMGVPMALSENISVQFEEYEALRLADYEDLSHAEAARRMNVSRPTFTRMYEKIRKKIAQAFVEGRSILIEGGNVEFDKQWYRCPSCHTIFHASHDEKPVCTSCGEENVEHINESLRQWQTGQRHRRGQGWQQARDKVCECPNCGHKTTSGPGKPCTEIACPECGHQMIRE
jgi:predicted DNA-binding protein (UPF0251 family)/predicted RNA-binding Zn-ribbon protein involved in translation (DUF1610 family)